LLERAGDVVSREELQRKIWTTDTFVDFNQGLNNAVKKLREALGDEEGKGINADSSGLKALAITLLKRFCCRLRADS
jgi:Transcriptional regulatory protein, C terminal